MTPTKQHREMAAENYDGAALRGRLNGMNPEHAVKAVAIRHWVETGAVDYKIDVHWSRLDSSAQSLADLESAIHARYAGLIEAAKRVLRYPVGEDEQDALHEALEELEKVNDG